MRNPHNLAAITKTFDTDHCSADIQASAKIQWAEIIRKHPTRKNRRFNCINLRFFYFKTKSQLLKVTV